MKNGAAVAEFEREFAQFVHARYAIALCNGTATLHTALAALGAQPGDDVYVPPLTMASTTLAALHAGCVPNWIDVDPATWLMGPHPSKGYAIPVALYGLVNPDWEGWRTIVDAAQSLAIHNPNVAFTSYSFQASKHLPLGEGGMLVTDDEELAELAREFSSLGYRMNARQPRIDVETLKSPIAARHHSVGWNYRMSDLVAAEGVRKLASISEEMMNRAHCAGLYHEAMARCSWLKRQYVPETWTHHWWAWSVAISEPELWETFVRLIVAHGGERPYAAWRLTYNEPVFEEPYRDACPHAEWLQPRLLQFQTNSIYAAHRNSDAVEKALRDIEG